MTHNRELKEEREEIRRRERDAIDYNAWLKRQQEENERLWREAETAH